MFYNLSVKTKLKHHKNYTKFNDSYQLVFSLNFEMFIPEDDSVRLLSHILEGLDYSKLYKAYSSVGRNFAIEPKILFKVLTYAYMNNIYSSRAIERACRRDINFMWLLQGYKAPDHSTISRFRSKYLASCLESLFYQLVKKLKDINEIEYENIFIDGTKIEANANRYTFVWRKAINKNSIKLLSKLELLMAKINNEFICNFKIDKENMITSIESVLEFLSELRFSKDINFVYGKGKRKTNIQKYIEELESYRVRQENYEKCNKVFENRNSFSKTDNDATFMHMKDDHMRNSQLKPGYNVQIGVESEYITAVGIFQDRNDTTTLIPFLNNIEENFNIKYKNVIADSGYESEENYLSLESKNQKYYIKPQTYEKWKKRSFKNDISKRENMTYDQANDEYTCHNGKKLKVTGVMKRKSVTGYESEVTMYECEECNNCKYKNKCTKAKGNRKMQVSKKFIEKRQISYENIITEQGIRLRINRSIQVEGAFGVLKNDYKFNRFLTRGKNNVQNEFILLCFGYNINKLHSKIQTERCGKHLHNIKIA